MTVDTDDLAGLLAAARERWFQGPEAGDVLVLERPADATLIALAPDLARDLLAVRAERDRLRAALERVRDGRCGACRAYDEHGVTAALAGQDAPERIGPRPAHMTCRGCPAHHEERWREPSGDGETWDSGTYNRCQAAGSKTIDGSYGSHLPTPPEWCPARIAGQDAPRAGGGGAVPTRDNEQEADHG